MELKKCKIMVCCSILLGLFASSFVQAAVIVSEPSYFVRPALRVSDADELIDGIEVNGATEKTVSQGVLGYSESTVNLQEGTVKMYLEDFSARANLQTFGAFGERITIKNGAGTMWDIGFAIDGYLEAFAGGALIEGVEGTPSIFYDVGIAVYKAGQVMWNNFVPGFNDYDALLYQHSYGVTDINAEEEYSSYDLYEEVLGSVEIASDYEQYDIFTFTNVIVNTKIGDGLESYMADFLNTARFDQTFAPGVEAYSSSGQFMGLSAPPPTAGEPTGVPEPQSLLFFGIGLALFARSRAQSKK